MQRKNSRFTCEESGYGHKYQSCMAFISFHFILSHDYTHCLIYSVVCSDVNRYLYCNGLAQGVHGQYLCKHGDYTTVKETVFSAPRESPREHCYAALR
jgi:hypothetical protein